MKRVLFVFIALVMVLSTACGVSEKDKEMVRGKLENGKFVSEFAGFTFAPGDTWTFASDEELLSMMNLVAEDMDTKEKAEFELSSKKTVYDAMAVDQSGANVIIMYENLALSVGGTSYDEKAYSEVLAESYNAQGFTGFTEGESVKIGDEEYYVSIASLPQEGMEIRQTILLRKIGKFMCCIAITTVPDYTASFEDILKMFS